MIILFVGGGGVEKRFAQFGSGSGGGNKDGCVDTREIMVVIIVCDYLIMYSRNDDKFSNYFILL